MLQGVGSNVGKSLLTAGLARAYANRGLAVRPFKPQNMSNNAAVTDADGEIRGEIGRAQALQARAARVAASVHMNPVLLKPQSEIGAQVIVQGKVTGNADARAYHQLKPSLMPAVLDSFERLGRDADLILVEGAGSPAEVNLRAGDIANMGFAEATGTPVILVADVERGGALAAIVGTCALLEAAERRLLKGYVINKFRGCARQHEAAPEQRQHQKQQAAEQDHGQHNEPHRPGQNAKQPLSRLAAIRFGLDDRLPVEFDLPAVRHVQRPE